MTPINPYVKISEARNAAVKAAMPWREGSNLFTPSDDGYCWHCGQRLDAHRDSVCPSPDKKIVMVPDGKWVHSGDKWAITDSPIPSWVEAAEECENCHTVHGSQYFDRFPGKGEVKSDEFSPIKEHWLIERTYGKRPVGVFVCEAHRESGQWGATTNKERCLKFKTEEDASGWLDANIKHGEPGPTFRIVRDPLRVVTIPDGEWVHDKNGFRRDYPTPTPGICENCHTVLHNEHIICTDCAAKILDAVMTEPPSETPRTDAAQYHPLASNYEWVVDAEFAEELEKELAAANTKIQGLERDAELLERRHDAMVSHEKQLREKCESLEQWKKQASTVLDRIKLEEVAKEIKVPLGKDISPAILPWIREAKARIVALEEMIRHAPHADHCVCARVFTALNTQCDCWKSHFYKQSAP